MSSKHYYESTTHNSVGVFSNHRALLAYWTSPQPPLGIHLQIRLEIKALNVATLVPPGRQHYSTECYRAFQEDLHGCLFNTICTCARKVGFDCKVKIPIIVSGSINKT